MSYGFPPVASILFKLARFSERNKETSVPSRYLYAIGLQPIYCQNVGGTGTRSFGHSTQESSLGIRTRNKATASSDTETCIVPSRNARHLCLNLLPTSDLFSKASLPSFPQNFRKLETIGRCACSDSRPIRRIRLLCKW